MSARACRCFLAALAILIGLTQTACDPPPVASPDGGPPRVIEALEPPGSQIGLHYREEVELRALYRSGDEARTPIEGAQLRFGIFGDPAGSTLSQDRATTDPQGVASVRLTAGAAEASFRVVVSATNAPDAEFAISVSKLDFVALDVQLVHGAPGTAATLRALLYSDRGCAALPPQPASPPALRQLSQAGSSAVLRFMNLLSRSYAVVGRAEDAGGRLIGYGCAELDAALVPPGSRSTLPLPLSPVRSALLGAYQVSTAISVDAQASTAPWHALVLCPRAPASRILDGIGARVGAALAAELELERGAVDSAGCRPALAPGGGPSLDQQLQDLLIAPMAAPAAALPAIVLDLDAITAAAQLTSRLEVSGTETAPSGRHSLEALRLTAVGGAQVTYDLEAAGLPGSATGGIVLRRMADALEIGAHELQLGLPLFWRRALEDLSLAPRLPALLPPRLQAFVEALVEAAAHGGQQGCAAVESLVCTATMAASCAGAIAPACAAERAALLAELEASLAPPAELDLPLAGQVALQDQDGDLRIDALVGGTWTSAAATEATFTASRLP